MWKWLFLVIYLATTGFNTILPSRKNIKSIIFSLIYLIVPCGLYFAFSGGAEKYSVLICIIISRALILLYGIINSSLFESVFAVIAILAFDSCLIPLVNGNSIPWQYVILIYIIIYCLIMLTPFAKTKKQNSGWLVLQNKRIAISITFMPLFSVLISLLSGLFSENQIVQIVIVFAVAMITGVLQEFVIKYLREKELVSVMSKWQAETREYMNTIRSQRHDFNLHLHAISGLIAGENYDECNEYIKKLVAQASQVNEIMPIYDAVIGSMLSEMRVAAKEKGISLTYDIKYDMKDVLCNAFECNKIIGNLIQNAIDASDTAREKEYGIQVSIFKKRGNTVITVENLCERNPEELSNIFNLGYSTKQGHEGLGLAMVEKTLKKYNGKIYVEFREQVIKFVAQIPNKISFDEDDI